MENNRNINIGLVVAGTVGLLIAGFFLRKKPKRKVSKTNAPDESVDALKSERDAIMQTAYESGNKLAEADWQKVEKLNQQIKNKTKDLATH